MTSDPPRRWDDDSPEEDAEVYRAAELARLERWAAEQKARPLTDALESHGMLPGDAAESWSSAPITPGWWASVPPPADPCAWCQRPVAASPCPECRAAREQDHGPAAAWEWWASLTAQDRRLLLAARWRRDPWSGAPVAIEVDWADVGDDGTITTGRHPYHPLIPATAWDLIRGGLA